MDSSFNLGGGSSCCFVGRRGRGVNCVPWNTRDLVSRIYSTLSRYWRLFRFQKPWLIHVSLTLQFGLLVVHLNVCHTLLLIPAHLKSSLKNRRFIQKKEWKGKSSVITIRGLNSSSLGTQLLTKSPCDSVSLRNTLPHFPATVSYGITKRRGRAQTRGGRAKSKQNLVFTPKMWLSFRRWDWVVQ